MPAQICAACKEVIEAHPENVTNSSLEDHWGSRKVPLQEVFPLSGASRCNWLTCDTLHHSSKVFPLLFLAPTLSLSLFLPSDPDRKSANRSSSDISVWIESSRVHVYRHRAVSIAPLTGCSPGSRPAALITRCPMKHSAEGARMYIYIYIYLEKEREREREARECRSANEK